MKIILLGITIFIISCGSNNLTKNAQIENIFKEEMSFDEFKLKLKQYAEKSPYPNIDD